jgi:pimeloyl-ACP methyl ester carboxylesterase
MRLATHRPPGLVVTDHMFTVPVDHDTPGGASIELFARELVTPTRERDELPWMVFFEGGPGFGAPRPTGRDGSWLERALADWRVLLLDQRGTARSSPINGRTLAAIDSAEAQAEYLGHFRADSIVRDAELIRTQLLGADQQWDLVGQSYGGFCITSYLSIAPEGVRQAFVTGGLPPLSRTPDDVYRATYPRVLDKNRRYFERYPGDRERLVKIVEQLATTKVRLPGGDRLTPERLQVVGIEFGMAEGFERVHYLVEEAFFEDSDRPVFSERFLHGVEAVTSFHGEPLFAALHESIYCQGTASNWAAQRVRDEFPQFDPTSAEFVFTGEMIYPWMFEQQFCLQPLQAAAELVAARSDWPALYDRKRLGECQAKVAAVVYHDDMYVDAAGSLETAAAVQGLRAWVTNEYEHDGAYMDGKRVFDRLVKMAGGEL